MDYAAADVTHLRVVYERLMARLRVDGRMDWVGQEMAALAEPDTYRVNPERAWERLKLRTGNRRQLAMVQAIAAWREREAQRINIPRQSLLAVIAEAKALPEGDLPRAEKPRDTPKASPALVALLKVLLNAVAEQNNVAARLVASSEDIEALALESADGNGVLEGWRGEMFGKDALRLIRGEIALSAQGKRVKIIEVAGRGEA